MITQTTPPTLADSSVTSAKIADGTIVNADVNASAAIAYSKLNLATSIVNADVGAAAAIAKSKLASLDVVNADVNAAAAIAYSKLALTGAILNADLAGSIADTKLASPNNSTYSVLLRGSGRGTTAGAVSTSYFFEGTQADITTPTSAGSNTPLVPIFPFTAAEFAVAGLTTKLRVLALVNVAGAPAVTITIGLYPLVAGSSLSLGTVVAGSTVAFASPSANTTTSGNSGDLTIPADGNYAFGYTLSGTPSNGFTVHAFLQVRNV